MGGMTDPCPHCDTDTSAQTPAERLAGLLACLAAAREDADR